jgi:predicted flap endonuclease-1-like 5' DNA nuclease
MFSSLFYITLGFVVGYFLDWLQHKKKVEKSYGQQLAEAELAMPEAAKLSLEEDSPDFLQTINGIGPVYAKRLFESGIRSFSALAAADKSTLVEITKVRNVDQVDQWIVEAQNL